MLTRTLFACLRPIPSFHCFANTEYYLYFLIFDLTSSYVAPIAYRYCERFETLRYLNDEIRYSISFNDIITILLR